jgi:hypothetical protein
MSRQPNILTRIAVFFGILAILLGGCASANAPSRSAEEAGGAPAAPAEMPAAEPEAAFDSGATSSSDQAAERLVIQNASLSIVVDDPSLSMDTIAAMAEEMGGYVVTADLTYSTLDSGSEVPRATVTLRVPAERLEEALERIQGESDRAPLNKRIDSQDVTSEYTDLQSRLRNLEAAEAQLTEIMESANRTEDVLNVYSQLTQVRGDIEVIKGQIQYYEQAAALSSISIDILANAAVQPLTIGVWEPQGVAKSAVEALIYGLRFLVSAGIWIVLFFLPLAILVILPVWLVVLVIRRWRTRRKKAAPPSVPAS